jgi:hypothetical protein
MLYSLCFFCAGTWEGKIRSIFNGRLTLRPLLSVTKRGLQMRLTDADLRESFPIFIKTALLFTPHRLLEQTAEDLISQLFREARVSGALRFDQDGSVTLDEFADWLEQCLSTIGKAHKQNNSAEVASSAIPVSVKVPPLPRAEKERESGDISKEVKMAKSLLGLEGFAAEDIMDLIGESAHAGAVSISCWMRVVSLMRQFRVDPSDPEDGSGEAKLLAENIFNAVAKLSAPLEIEGEKAVSYTSLLSTLCIFSDSPEEEKLAVAFSVLADSPSDLSQSADRSVSYEKFLHFITGIFTIVKECSQQASKVISSLNISDRQLAVATVARALSEAQVRTTDLRDIDFDLFSTLAWICARGSGM